MTRIYIAAPFSSLTSRLAGRLYGTIEDNSFIELLERIDDMLREQGFSVCLPHRDKGQWGKLYLDPMHIADICFDEVERCDWVLAIPRRSRAAHMEIAVASQLRKKLIILLQRNDDPSIFTYGLWRRSPTIVEVFENDSDLFEKVRECIGLMRARADDTTFLQARSRDALSSFLEKRTLAQSGLSSPSAVVDFGSSSLKLTVARVENGFVSLLHEEKFSGAPLGDEVHKSKNLSVKAIDKNVEVLRGWVQLLQTFEVQEVKIVATGAARQAANRELLISRVRSATGHHVEIVDEQVEAATLYEGAVCDFPADNLVYAVLNIGGSTTKLIIGAKEKIHNAYHFDNIGVRSLRGDYLRSDPPTDDEYAGLVRFVEKTLERVKPISGSSQCIFLHTGGELDYVLSAGCRLRNSSLSPSHPKLARLSDFEAFAERLRRLGSSELYKLSPDPKNPRWMEGAIVCNAVAILVARKLGVKEIIPSNRNLTDGFILSMRRRMSTADVSGRLEATTRSGAGS